MAVCQWNEIARGFADYVQQFRLILERGAVSIQLYHDEDPSAADGLLVVGLFGNDNINDLAGREVDSIRKTLHDTNLIELGFSTSSDTSTWVLLIGEKKADLKTAAGQNFRKEMLKAFLEDLVWTSWRYVSGELEPQSAVIAEKQ